MFVFFFFEGSFTGGSICTYTIYLFDGAVIWEWFQHGWDRMLVSSDVIHNSVEDARHGSDEDFPVTLA